MLDRRSSYRQETQRLYKTARWLRLVEHQRRVEPFCRFCKANGVITAMEVADHIVPHRNDLTLFWDNNNVQSLCRTHHASDKQREEVGSTVIDKTIGIDGWPVSPQHYGNSGRYVERKSKQK